MPAGLAASSQQQAFEPLALEAPRSIGKGVIWKDGRHFRHGEGLCCLFEIVTEAQQFRFAERGADKRNRYGQSVFGHAGGNDKIGKSGLLAMMVPEPSPACADVVAGAAADSSGGLISDAGRGDVG